MQWWLLIPNKECSGTTEWKGNVFWACGGNISLKRQWFQIWQLYLFHVRFPFLASSLYRNHILWMTRWRETVMKRGYWALNNPALIVCLIANLSLEILKSPLILYIAKTFQPHYSIVLVSSIWRNVLALLVISLTENLIMWIWSKLYCDTIFWTCRLYWTTSLALTSLELCSYFFLDGI